MLFLIFFKESLNSIIQITSHKGCHIHNLFKKCFSVLSSAPQFMEKPAVFDKQNSR